MNRDKNFSCFYQIIFLNSRKEQALLQSPAFHPFLLKYSTPHVFIANYPTYLKIRCIPGSHVSFSIYINLKMADGHVATCSISHYAFRWWTNIAWALETVETKSMKGTSCHFSTWHDGILEQYIRCGVHQSAITFDQFHSFRILEEKLW